MKVSEWTGLYNKQWGSMLRSESFSHPAKVSPGLAEKIFQYGIESGWLEKGSVCGDPFGGIGGFAIYGAYAGLKFICVELEQKFVDLAQENFELHRPAWEAHGYPVPVILQGDSREFSRIIGGCDSILTSPPYISGGHHPDQTGAWGGLVAHKGFADKETASYGTTPGQIGRLKAGDLKAIVTSPPYAESITRKGDLSEVIQARMRKKGWSESSIRKVTTNSNDTQSGYSNNPSNIGNLKMDSIVTSPPFTQGYQSGGGINKKGYGKNGKDKVGSRTYQGTGGDRHKDNIENTENETYWQAMTQVYQECHKALKPGGEPVLKDPKNIKFCECEK